MTAKPKKETGTGIDIGDGTKIIFDHENNNFFEACGLTVMESTDIVVAFHSGPLNDLEKMSQCVEHIITKMTPKERYVLLVYFLAKANRPTF